ncbi:MAG: protease complex subunit PrcB family protein [Verrucomicrobiota bacterium]
MTPLRSLFLSSVGLMLLGCISTLAAGPALRSLAKGAISGLQEQKEEVIRDAAGWQKLWTAHATSSKTAGTLPEVDFDREMVIVATSGRHSTGGYSIEVTRVEQLPDKLRVYITRKAPPSGAMAIQVLTAPFHMVAVPKSSWPVEFVVNDVAGGKKK